MNEYPKRYLFSFDSIIDMIRQTLSNNIVVIECLIFSDVLDYELEVALVGEQWRYCYGDDKLEVFLIDFCPQTERRQLLIKEIRALIERELHIAMQGPPVDEHQYEYQRLDNLGGYAVIDLGDYRIEEYYRLLREKDQEARLEHGWIPERTPHHRGSNALVRKVQRPGV